jgi:hypothetical protein
MIADYLEQRDYHNKGRARRQKEVVVWKSTKTVALEQHVDAITVAGAAPGRQPPEFCDDIPSTPEAVRKLLGRLDDGKIESRPSKKPTRNMRK